MSATTIGPSAAGGPGADAPGLGRTAFVLGGGGNLGAVQVGMLAALFERDIRPDLVLGCSAGALNAAVVAQDPTPGGVRALAHIWSRLRGDDVFPAMRFAGPWLLLRRGASMCPNSGLRSLLSREVRLERFEEAAVPFEVVATELASGRARWFTEGPIAEPILASAALPAILPPVEIDGELYIDGGVVENVPIHHALERGCDRVVVLHVGNFSRPRARPGRPIDTLLQAFSIARNYDFLRESTRPPAGVELIVLPAVDPGGLKRNDFSRARELMARAREAAGRFLDERRGTAHPA
jgi:NTE family protein